MSKMKIAIVTNTELHHKYFVYEMYRNFDVSLIIHPTGNKKSIINKLKQKDFFYYGFLIFVLKMLSILYGSLSNLGLKRSIKNAEKQYFSSFENEYNKISKTKIKFVETVNSEIAIQLVKSHNIDVICFLGGDIAKEEFINSAKICLNYHNGVSPFYNGNKANFHAVSDFRPNFSGGTLMKMNKRIDGGEILMHYLCAISSQDKAVDLYMKSIMGAVKTYHQFLNNNNIDISGINQKRSFRFVRNIDWTLLNDIKLRKFYKYNRMRLYERKEIIIEYQNTKSIKDLYSIILTEILG